MRQKEALEIAHALHFRDYDDAEAVLLPSGQYAVKVTLREAEGRRVFSALHDLVMVFPKKPRTPAATT